MYQILYIVVEKMFEVFRDGFLLLVLLALLTYNYSYYLHTFEQLYLNLAISPLSSYFSN